MEDETQATTSTGAASKKRKDEKNRRRDQRAWENVMKVVAHLPETEKMSVIQEKYNDLYNEVRATSNSLFLMEKQYATLQREKDHLQTDLTKNILQKSKLEDVCRELQKQNKIIKDENITRVKEEEERRREVATNLTEKLNTLTALMDENKDKSALLREENISMTAKLTELYDQFQEREAHLANMNHQMELQKKLSEAQLKKLEVEFETERQLWQKEKEIILTNLEKSDTTNRILQENVQGLQSHIEVYKSQYADFENTMQKSNKVFDAFREEMTRMQKTNLTLEKERNDYCTRWQSCTQSVVQLSEMHQQAKTDLKVFQKKVQMLEKLCRQLQTERSAYIQQLKEHSIEPVVSIQDGGDDNSNPGPSTSTGRKLTKKEQTLASLEAELSELKMLMEEQHVPESSTTSTPTSSKAKENLEKGAKKSSPKMETLHEKETNKSANREPEVCDTESAEATGSGEANTTVTLTQTKEDTIVNFPDSSSESEIEVVLAKVSSCPETSVAEQSISDVNLTETLSLGSIPLCKQEAVTDITAYHGAVDLEAQTSSETLTESTSDGETNVLHNLDSDMQNVEVEVPFEDHDYTVPASSSNNGVFETVATLKKNDDCNSSCTVSNASTSWAKYTPKMLRAKKSQCLQAGGNDAGQTEQHSIGDVLSQTTIPLHEVGGKTDIKKD